MNQILHGKQPVNHGTVPFFINAKHLVYNNRKKIRENQSLLKTSYSNDLHDALLKKNGKSFWNCWNSKFESHIKCGEVEGSVDANIIAEKFSDHFSKSYVANNSDRANCLYEEYAILRDNYIGFPAN